MDLEKDCILYLDDELYNLELLKYTFEDIFDVFIALNAKDAFDILRTEKIKVVISDQRMPDISGIDFIKKAAILYPDAIFMIITANFEINFLFEAINEIPVYRVLLKPWNNKELETAIHNAMEIYNLREKNKFLIANLEEKNKELTLLKDKLEVENLYLQEEIKLNYNFKSIISVDRDFQKLLKQVEKVASTDTTVLLLGETGTGKELIARSIHDLSARHDKPLIKVNCAAIPATLIESELFGHEKGAFTGASNLKIGKFELADGGTLFLDEIGEMPFELQSKLLRVLQEGELERLGGNKTIKINVRIITATNRNLEEEIKKGLFRVDLFYRLNVFPLILPPLRDRKKDIPVLMRFFLDKYNKKMGKQVSKISNADLDKMNEYLWPGNIRELENVVERAVVLATDSMFEIGRLINVDKTTGATDSAFCSLEQMERDYIVKVLNHASWKVSGKNGAAEMLKLNRTTLISKMNKLGIKKE